MLGFVKSNLIFYFNHDSPTFTALTLHVYWHFYGKPLVQLFGLQATLNTYDWIKKQFIVIACFLMRKSCGERSIQQYCSLVAIICCLKNRFTEKSFRDKGNNSATNYTVKDRLMIYKLFNNCYLNVVKLHIALFIFLVEMISRVG